MSRAQRTKQFSETNEKNWAKKYWKFVKNEIFSKYLDWKSISANSNITLDITTKCIFL